MDVPAITVVALNSVLVEPIMIIFVPVRLDTSSPQSIVVVLFRTLMFLLLEDTRVKNQKKEKIRKQKIRNVENRHLAR